MSFSRSFLRVSDAALFGRHILPALFVITSACKLEQAGSATPPVQSAASRAQPSGDARSCLDYAESICDKTGEETPTCSAWKTVAELMSPRTCGVGMEDLDHSLTRFAAVRQPCEALRQSLCDAFAPESEMCDFVRVQIGQFPVEQCKAMSARLPDVIADLKRLHAARKPLPADVMARIAAGNGPGFGPGAASVEVVAFSDFECPYCSRAARVVGKLRELYGERIRFVFRQYPLSIHPNARLAAVASLAAHAQGKFWPYHDRLFANQGTLDRSALEEHARVVGLDLARFKSSLDDPTLAEQVESDLVLGKSAEVEGTPTLFVNGHRIAHPTDLTTVVNAIERALAQTSSG